MPHELDEQERRRAQSEDTSTSGPRPLLDDPERLGLAESFEALKLAIDSACVIAFTWDVANDRVYRHVSREPALPATGDEPSTIAAVRERVVPEDRDRFMRDIETALSDPEGLFRSEVRIARPDGEIRWLRATGRVVFDGGGRPLRLTGVSQDITESHRAESALRESEARFRTMADGLPLIVWVHDAEGHQEFVNKTFCDFFGVTLEQTRGGGWQLLMHPDDERAYTEEFFRCVAARCLFHAETRVRRHDGEWRWLESWGRPRFDESGEFRGYVGTSADVTERRRIEQDRKELLDAERAARAELERVARIKDEFLATLSHELRTPLSAILGWAEILERRLPAGDAGQVDLAMVRKGVKIIGRNARLQTQLVADLLDVNRLVSGKFKLEVGAVDLNLVAAAAADTVRPAAEARGVRLVLRLSPEPPRCQGDAGRLQQVLWNLLSNAVKFTPAGGTVSLSTEVDGGSLRIAVEDTGQGIDPAFVPRLFDRFSQADASAARKHGGLGLGLSIVKQIVEMHGGTVTAASDGPGRGARFTVTLPSRRPTASEAIEARALASEIRSPSAPTAPRPSLGSGYLDAGDVDLSGVRILLVDDEPEAIDLARHLLVEAGATVTHASSAPEALERIRASVPDVLLADISMPGMDGYGLIHEVRHTLGLDAARLPAVTITALSRPEDHARMAAAGYQAHVGKPIHGWLLLETVTRLTRSAPPDAPWA